MLFTADVPAYILVCASAILTPGESFLLSVIYWAFVIGDVDKMCLKRKIVKESNDIHNGTPLGDSSEEAEGKVELSKDAIYIDTGKKEFEAAESENQHKHNHRKDEEHGNIKKAKSQQPTREPSEESSSSGSFFRAKSPARKAKVSSVLLHRFCIFHPSMVSLGLLLQRLLVTPFSVR